MHELVQRDGERAKSKDAWDGEEAGQDGGIIYARSAPAKKKAARLG